jgi:hypothetical protein
MNIKVFIFSIFAILSNIETVVTQLVNNNNLVINDIQTLISKTQRSIRAYLSTILVDDILQNVDAIFTSANLDFSTIINKNYNCVTLTSNFLSWTIKFVFYF